MNHNVNSALAMRLGITSALVAEFLWDEILTGDSPPSCSWIKSTQKMFTVEFPYISERTIRRTLKRLVDKGIVRKIEHNASPFDRTLSYQFTEFGENIMRSDGCNS
jgi:DNA-binding PadR family transcriptional regulator